MSECVRVSVLAQVQSQSQRVDGAGASREICVDTLWCVHKYVETCLDTDRCLQYVCKCKSDYIFSDGTVKLGIIDQRNIIN